MMKIVVDIRWALVFLLVVLFVPKDLLIPSASLSRNAQAPHLKTKHSNINATVEGSGDDTPVAGWFSTQKGLSQAALKQWCPLAECRVTGFVCHPCKRRFLFVLATGRTASTTLHTMLNALPGVRLAGENNGMLGEFMYAVANTREKKAWKDSPKQAGAGPWGHYPAPNASFACVTQQMVETINPPRKWNETGDPSYAEAYANAIAHDIVGFKTIRFPLHWSPIVMTEEPAQPAGKNRVDRAARFLMETFPCARYVINSRSDVASHAASLQRTWAKKFSSEQVEQAVRSRNEDLQNLAALLGPERAFVMDSSVWTRNLTAFNEVVTWLGYDAACHFRQLFDYNHQRIYGKGRTSSRNNPTHCARL